MEEYERAFIVFYNVLDTLPFCEVIQKIREPYLRKGVDIFNSSFSILETAKIEMQKRMDDNAFFCLFPKKHADLYDTYCQNITCGLSIIFTSLAIKNETKIRPHEFENPETCHSVLGLDANSLHFHAIN